MFLNNHFQLKQTKNPRKTENVTRVYFAPLTIILFFFKKNNKNRAVFFLLYFKLIKKKAIGVNHYLRGVMEEGSNNVEMAGAVIAFKLKEASSWWQDINESPFWQDRIFHVLAALYSIVAAVALVRPPHLPCLFLCLC